jgi:hypothetical protein
MIISYTIIYIGINARHSSRVAMKQLYIITLLDPFVFSQETLCSPQKSGNGIAGYCGAGRLDLLHCGRNRTRKPLMFGCRISNNVKYCLVLKKNTWINWSWDVCLLAFQAGCCGTCRKTLIAERLIFPSLQYLFFVLFFKVVCVTTCFGRRRQSTNIVETEI